MAEIKWVEGEIPKPGTCVSCGTADHAGRRFATLSKFIKMYGKVLICNECIDTILRLPGLDFVPRIELEMAKTETKVYRDRVEPTMDVLRSVRDFCNEHLNPDGSPKDPKVKLLSQRRTGASAGARNAPIDPERAKQFFGNDPDDAA